MKHYLKLSALFFVFTMGVTCWMSYELGLLGFGKLEAAEPTATTQATAVSNQKAGKEEPPSLTATPPQPPAKPANSDLANLPIAEREKYVSDREEFLRKQSEYYEKVILELKEKLANQNKENKQHQSKNEASFQQRLNEKDAQWKAKIEKAEADWKTKVAEKDSENNKLKKELASWKDARAELFRGMYEKMESKKSAKILETMDVDLSNKILAGMKQDKAAEIMSKMIPEKAKLITEKTFQKRELSSQNKVNTSQGVESEKSP